MLLQAYIDLKVVNAAENIYIWQVFSLGTFGCK